MSDVIFPEYHEQGMGCGLEDQGITDRYDACRYGYEQALEDVNNDVVNDLERQLEEARDERECLRLLLLNWSGLLQSDIDNELNKLKEQG